MARVGDLSDLSSVSGSELVHDDATREDAAVATLYWIQPVGRLPRVALSATLASRVLCWRRSAAESRAFDARLVKFVDRWLPHLQLLVLVGVPALVAVFFVRDPTAQACASLVAFATGMPLMVLAIATLSWDMLKLTTRSFDFWFLTAVNLVNTMLFYSLFRDVRAVGITSGSVFFQLTLLTDANLRTRLAELRFLVFGAPLSMVVVLACIVRVTPGLHYRYFSVLGAALDDVDLLLNGNFIIAFFTALKTHRNRHLLAARHSHLRHIVQCQMFFPQCRLAASSRETVQLLRAKSHRVHREFTRKKSQTQHAHATTISHEQTLHMVPSAVADAVDMARVLVPIPCFLSSRNRRGLQWGLNLAALVGLVCSVVAHVDCMLRPETSPLGTHLNETTLEVLGLSLTLLFTLAYAAQCQRDLLRMVMAEVDAWFSAVHFVMVAGCVADIVDWDHRALPVLAACLWSLWILVLDAVPPSTRRRLGFQRWFLLLVNVLLLVFHVSLVYALFFTGRSSTGGGHRRPPFRNRVLVDVTVRSVHLWIEMFSFITSKIFTSLVWMGRLLWRESFRPRDAFKLIKHRAQFLIPRP